MLGAALDLLHPAHSRLRVPLLFWVLFRLGTPQGKGRGSGASEPPEPSTKRRLGEGIMSGFGGKVPLAEAGTSVRGCGRKGKGGEGVRFSFSDVLMGSLVKIALFLLIAA